MKKYQITNIRWAGTRWLADVGTWNSCICECEPVTVEIRQTNRPTRSDIIEAYLKSV